MCRLQEPPRGNTLTLTLRVHANHLSYYSRNPSSLFLLSRTTIESIAWCAHRVYGSDSLWRNLLSLRLSGFPGLLALSGACWRRKENVNSGPDLTTIQQFTWPSARGVRRYCIKNSCSTARGGNDDLVRACLKVWTRLSAAPLVTGWYGAPVR